MVGILVAVFMPMRTCSGYNKLVDMVDMLQSCLYYYWNQIASIHSYLS